MHHYRRCARNPLISWRGEPLSLLIFLCGGKESKCLPRTGANANNPITKQGKANTIKTQTRKRLADNQIKKSPTPQKTQTTATPTPQANNNKRRAGKQTKQTPTP
jgi:hypothetical protein